eukprot:2471658-Amphidinium_carterae.1
MLRTHAMVESRLEIDDGFLEQLLRCIGALRESTGKPVWLHAAERLHLNGHPALVSLRERAERVEGSA